MKYNYMNIYISTSSNFILLIKDKNIEIIYSSLIQN